ncbi:MAG: erythronate-4-phosphate dehydrogenase [Moraxellaceae bacterium]|jgi:erythronate-4-phosphate dehydrogenase|nr:erythronate-4-phosphate dehydrogenase [Moraxellaceae bacterium]
MQIVADENMPLVAELFAAHEVRRLPGRAISAGDLQAADALLVRSVTRVDRSLLEGTPVRFVGTATIGTDHIDLPAMAGLGIHVASAPGCNARAVGEYVATALAILAAEQGWQPGQRTLGVVGLGNTGRQVVALACALGFRVLGCDPFVCQPDIEQLPFAELVERADILSFHVPLVREGSHPTWRMADARVLSGLCPGAVLINACRGEVVDGAALLAALHSGRDLTAVLDVWEGEPRIQPDLLAAVALGSPHVAGYSQEGKWRGTEMVHRAFCEFFGQSATTTSGRLWPAADLEVQLPVAGDPGARLAAILRQACPIPRDLKALRDSMSAPDRGAAFDALRRDYPPRREFTAWRARLPGSDPLRQTLAALGFRLA